MDRTVVIRGLIRILTKADNHDNGVTYEVSLYRDEYDAIEEAIRMLEKQAPRVPDVYDDGSWDCPGCGWTYDMDTEPFEFCPHCGQRINWEGVER